jgi:ribonuclease PH
MTRNGDRSADELRNWMIVPNVLRHAEGSALIEAGNTRVVCAATVEDRVPFFLRHSGRGWVTAEYSMLPRSTHTRTPRERGGRLGGRTQEIQRMIGRSLRCVVDLTGLGERTVTLDCDVLQADGGTRTASITAAWVALREAMNAMVLDGTLAADPIIDSVAAVSVGVVRNELLLDLDYDEDSAADVDMNVVITGQGRIVEVQATAERVPFSLTRMNSLVRLAKKGITEIFGIQRNALTDGEPRTVAPGERGII